MFVCRITLDLAKVAMIGTLLLSLPQTAPGEIIDFDRQILPLLANHCGHCHSTKSQKGELDLSTAAGIIRGSESGAIIDQQQPAQSRLIEVLENREMPPEGEGTPLTSAEISLIRRWIEEGASFGDDVDSSEDRIHRSLPPSVPPTGNQKGEAQPLHQHDVLPILLLRCASCHGRQTQESGLDIRSKSSLLRGGTSGPAIVPGNPQGSLLIQKIQTEAMPPRSKLASHSVKPVEATELTKLIRWIERGAPEMEIAPDVATTEPDSLVTNEDRSFWSFRSPRRPSLPPRTSSEASYRHPIDTFIADKLMTVGLRLSPSASRHVLVRRAFFDLIGLPPSREEMEREVEQRDPLAYERLIDRLLASPHYGERWGQYWLDLAGYSDSEGVQHSDPLRPHAYRYRDYVIQSLNADKPYDRFLLEQIAGDELANTEHASTITAEMYDNLVATGFLRMTSDGTFAGITGFVPNRLDVIDDQLRILTSSIMGLTVRCARCHSHKFDPIPQRDYYRLVALFKPAMDEHDWLKPVTGGNGNSSGSFRYLSTVTTAERATWEAHDRPLQTKIAELRAELDQSPKDENSKKSIEEAIQQLESQRQPEPLIRALWDRGDPSPTYLLRRGDYLQPTRLVGPGVPSVLTDGKTPFRPEPPWPGAKKTGNRLALARWLTHPDHPLTARVMVNRIWKHHFGRGLVETLDDFGRAGSPPSHPELLDWLAREFVRQGWSVKHIHRLIMTSATYQQQSASTPDQVRIDPENRLLSHMSLRRMDAEELRDSLLMMAGRLNRRQFGPADPVEAQSDGLVESATQRDGERRSIYLLKRRTQPQTLLETFDRPAMSPHCVARSVSIVAPQALHLLNNGKVHELTTAMAERLIHSSEANDSDRIDALYRVTTGRLPNEHEKQTLLAALDEMTAIWTSSPSDTDGVPSVGPNGSVGSEGSEGSDSVSPGGPRDKAFANLCHAMINSARFLYID